MPATSVAFNACDAGMILADQNGAFHDVSFTALNFKIDRNHIVGEFRVFGDANTYRLTCKKDGSASLKAICSKDTYGAYNMLENWYETGDIRWIQLTVPDNSVGGYKYEGYFILESLSIEASADQAGPMTIDANLKPNGPIDRSVITT